MSPLCVRCTNLTGVGSYFAGHVTIFILSECLEEAKLSFLDIPA